MVQQSRSPLFTPWGGVGQALFRSIEHDLDLLKKADIQPFFVFNGLQVLSQHDIDPDARLRVRAQAFNNLEIRRNDETVQAFSALTYPSDLTPALKHYFKLHGIEFLVAPYFAGAQLAYMISVDLLDAIYAAPDILVFGAERIITDISFNAAARVTFCDRATVLGAQLLGLNEDQFLDAFLFAGNEFCDIVPILQPNSPSEYSAYRVRAAADVVRQNGTGYLALNGNPVLEKKPSYMEDWLNARTLFKHHPYLNKEGDVVLFKASKAPNDVARVIGARLPREIYFYLSRGLIEPQTLNHLLSGVWLENRPLDGGESKQYRTLLDSLSDFRGQCMDLLHGSKQLHHYYEKKVVVFRKWYEDNHSKEIDKLEQPLYEEIKHWRIGQQYIDKHCSGSRELRSILQSLQNPIAVKATFDKSTSSIVSTEDVQTNTLLRLLQIRGYISAEHTLTAWGRALLLTLDSESSANSWTIISAVELLKLHGLKAETYTTRSQKDSPVDEQIDIPTRLTSRLAVFFPLRQNEAPWQGPLDREALISFSLANTTARYLATLYELVQLSLLLRGDAKRAHGLIDVIGHTQNPFSVSYDAGLAIYAKQYLTAWAEVQDGKTQEIAPRLKHTFPTSVDGETDFRAVLDIWSALYRAVKSIASDKQMGAVELQKFEQTENWLTAHR